MGVSGGGDLLYSLKNLRLAHLVTIATSRAIAAGRTVPRIDIDANWLIRKYFSKNGVVQFGSIVEIIAALVQAGFAVSILFDGDERPHVKMAYFARRTEVEVARIDAIKAKGTVMTLSQRLSNSQYESGEEKVRLTTELAREEKFLSSCESKANNAPPSDCYDLLKEAVESITDTSGKGGSIALIAKATYEADYAISCRAKYGQTDLILGNDADYHGIVGDRPLRRRQRRIQEGPASTATTASFQIAEPEAARAVSLRGCQVFQVICQQVLATTHGGKLTQRSVGGEGCGLSIAKLIRGTKELFTSVETTLDTPLPRRRATSPKTERKPSSLCLLMACQCPSVVAPSVWVQRAAVSASDLTDRSER